jgi:integrase
MCFSPSTSYITECNRVNLYHKLCKPIPIRTIFKDAFESADLPYFNPHSFRKTLVTFGQKHCQSIEEFKAWSQNLGHENVLTTLYSYVEVQQHRC